MYLRFLNNNDYLDVMTQKAFDQMTRDRADELCEAAEKAAEASIREYLTEHYDIDYEFDVGKYIAGYSPDINISYPANVHIYYDGEICETLEAINGTKKPMNNEFWEEIPLKDIPDKIDIPQYSQMETYSVGKIVQRSNNAYRCIKPNGIGVGDIRIPDMVAWDEVEYEKWLFQEWSNKQVCYYLSDFYELNIDDDYDPTVSPDKSSSWVKLDYYDESKRYDIGDKCVYTLDTGEDVVVEAITNVNRTVVSLGVNIAPSDPRNFTLRKYMVKLAAYELAKQISPNNVSVMRIKDYDEAMTWLNRAGSLRITPHIKRKRKSDGGKTNSWVTSRFVRPDGSKKYGWGNW